MTGLNWISHTNIRRNDDNDNDDNDNDDNDTWAEHWDERLVNPTISANKMLKYSKR